MIAQLAIVAVGTLCGLALTAVFWTLDRLPAPARRTGFEVRYEHLPEHRHHDR